MRIASIADISVTECDEIVIVIDNLSTKKTNTKSINVTSTSLINCHSKKERDCYILHTVLLTILLLLILLFTIYYYLLSLCKTRRYSIKLKIMNFKKFVLEIVRVIISMT